MSALEKLSEPTGGRAFHVSGRLRLEDVFAQIGEDIGGSTDDLAVDHADFPAPLPAPLLR